MKKDLLIFFGQYRTFDVILPQLQDLDKVDVIVSTWSDGISKQKIDLIYKHIPHAIVLTADSNELDSILFENLEYEDGFSVDSLENTTRMYYHWKKVINYVDETKYQKVILHRTDTISDWNKVLDFEFKENTLYLNDSFNGDVSGSTSSGIEVKKGVIDHHWVDDHFIFGNMNIMKLFINYIENDKNYKTHFHLGNVILKNTISTINWSDKINVFLIRNNSRKKIEDLNKNNISLINSYNNQLPPFETNENWTNFWKQ